MKLLALSALICALMALTLAADAAEPEQHSEPGSEPESEPESELESEPESEPEEANAENPVVEKRFFCLLHHIFHKFKRPRPHPPCRPRPRPPCRPRTRWTRIGHRYFHYIPHYLTWRQAEHKCRHLGGHLASVHSAWEYQQIRNLIARYSGHHPRTWIGGTHQRCGGHWKWSDGSCFNYKGWCCGEPNNQGKACLEINFSGHKCWNDLGCHNKLPSVCVRNRC